MIPEKLKSFKTNLGRTKHYDQIAFRTPDIGDQSDATPAGVLAWDEVAWSECASPADSPWRWPSTTVSWRPCRVSPRSRSLWPPNAPQRSGSRRSKALAFPGPQATRLRCERA